ncbi:hypothetical protein K443DRAFT_474398 [Laccaria amethystina LaAM-08-1]|uniref:Secreted protein n=1 Tax=Laccaria amethystina LaAM-08-1 TaxID=1095629 RepID=A0A0C9WHS6_9AGAR|nr:hypothetical protein K443DRAFT_474398 [Laccaria amethystina LaAM-08-1]
MPPWVGLGSSIVLLPSAIGEPLEELRSAEIEVGRTKRTASARRTEHQTAGTGKQIILRIDIRSVYVIPVIEHEGHKPTAS